MIIDTFLFNDEFEMLDIRLSISDLYVDKWIILEGNKTWSGKDKPYHLKNNLSKFEKYKDKIILINLEIPKDYKDWYCENFSRKSLTEGLKICSDNDIIIHSDLDEIINFTYFNNIIELLKEKNLPVSCELQMFIHKFDQLVDRKWKGPVVAKKYMITDLQKLYRGVNHKKKDRSHCVTYPNYVGWHWTWIGNDERIKNKVVSCIESQFKDPNQVLKSLKTQDTVSAINHKCSTKFFNANYPDYILQIIKKYPYWSY